MKKFLLFCLAFVVSMVAKADYQKVTATADITTGDYLIVYEEGNLAFNGALETLDAVSNSVAVTINEGMIASTAEIDAATFKVDVENGTLKSASGKYVYHKTYANGLSVSDEAPSFLNAFSIDDDGNAVIAVTLEGGTVTMRFNKADNQMRFRYYKTGQQPVALYKKVSSSDPILTLMGTVGEEVTLAFGVYESEDEFSVDFGDGNLQTAKVGLDNKGPVQPDGTTPTATTFTGTIAGDGTIKVYGNNDIWYYNTSGNVLPTSFDQAKLMNVVQMTISGANVESVVLPAYEKMTQFSFTNSPVKSVDISSVPTLTRIDLYNTTQSAYEPQLESIDVSKNVNLETIVLGGNTYKKGAITALDLTNNTSLTQLSAENNKIATITGMPVSLKNIYLSNNELASLTFPEFTTKGTIQIQNNLFTLATLPTKPAITSTSKYTYAPQPAYEVAESVTELDLSSQLTATGVAEGEQTTTYSFVTASGTALVEGTDYEVTAPGQFKFIKEQTEKVHGVMATAAFPKFTGANAYVTTEFDIVPATGITTVHTAKKQNGKYYNLQGVEVLTPGKGLYIVNGKKVVIK